MPFDPTPLGKHVIPTRKEPLSDLEASIMNPLDVDKLSDLAEVLYAFNNYKVGPMSGFFVAVEITPGKNGVLGNYVLTEQNRLNYSKKNNIKLLEELNEPRKK